MMLPGLACLYYGQEIGMVNGPVRPDQRKDPHIEAKTLRLRDFSRTPMQWDDSMNAGKILIWTKLQLYLVYFSYKYQ